MPNFLRGGDKGRRSNWFYRVWCTRFVIQDGNIYIFDDKNDL